MITNPDFRSRFIKITIISLVFAAAWVLALFIPRIMENRSALALYLFLAPILLGAILVLLWKPTLGLVVLVAADLLVPFSIGTGSQTTLSVPVLLIPVLAGIGVLTWLTRRQPLHLFDARTTWPLVSLIVIVLLAFVNGQLPWFDAAQRAPLTSQLGGAALYIFSVLAFLLVGAQIQEIRWLKRLVWIFLGWGSVYIFSALVPGAGNLLLRYVPQGITGALFWTWLVAISFSQGVFNRRLKPVFRLLFVGAACGALYIGLFRTAGWTSGWLPAVVAVLVIVWVGAPKVGLVLSAALGVGFILFHQRFTGFLMGGDNTYSLETRLAAWQILTEIVKASPILGFGPANYHFYTPLFPIMGYAVEFNSHNNYVDLVAQTGLLGLAAYLWFLGEAGRLGWSLRSRAAQGFERAYVYGAIGGLAGTAAAGMLGDWVIPFVYNIGFTGFRASMLAWLFLGGLVVLERIYHKYSSPTPAANLE